jgi:hypothetical protein
MLKKSKQKPVWKPVQEKSPSLQWDTRQKYQPSNDQEQPVWRFSLLDWDGPWGWHNVEANKWQEILQKLGHFETRTWTDIKSDGNNHTVWIKNSPNPETQKRLVELHLDDIHELFSLRLSGKERLWGILDRYILNILWWDPYHEVWPSTKKHT